MLEAQMETSNSSCPVLPTTFGPAYDVELDSKRISTQLEIIASVMDQARQSDQWLTLHEIGELMKKQREQKTTLKPLSPIQVKTQLAAAQRVV
jgi:hypothetical protein